MKRKPRLLTAGQAKAIDARVRDEWGVPTLLLMENAGRAIADEVRLVFKKKVKIAFICGKGNNGGDGFAAARHLLSEGINPDVYVAGKIKDVTHEARENLGFLLRLKEKITEIDERNILFLRKKIERADIIVDALLGVGLKGEVRENCKQLIHLINSSKAYIVAIDIPSGLDATSGRARGCCVKADKTITFVAKKKGMVTGDGPRYCGKVVVKQLGIPAEKIIIRKE